MSIARAFTTRRVKQSLEAAEASKGAAGSIRNKISGPVELIHTTNMLSYNAPDIFPKASPTASSTRSDDSLLDSAPTTASTPPTSPDVPTKRSASPEPNRLSSYFTVPQQATARTTESEPAPAIPQRAPSHTKRGTYEALGRQRSVSRLSEQSSRTVSTKASFTFSRSSSTSTSTTAPTSRASSSQHNAHAAKVTIPPVTTPSMTTPQSPPLSTPTSPPVQYHHKREYSDTHPFGQELAQVTELAEEYGARERLNVIDEEEQELASRGLFKFNAEDYLSEIREIFSNIFAEPRPAAAAWI